MLLQVGSFLSCLWACFIAEYKAFCSLRVFSHRHFKDFSQSFTFFLFKIILLTNAIPIYLIKINEKLFATTTKNIFFILFQVWSGIRDKFGEFFSPILGWYLRGTISPVYIFTDLSWAKLEWTLCLLNGRRQVLNRCFVMVVREVNFKRFCWGTLWEAMESLLEFLRNLVNSHV